MPGTVLDNLHFTSQLLGEGPLVSILQMRKLSFNQEVKALHPAPRVLPLSLPGPFFFFFFPFGTERPPLESSA